MLEEPRLSGPVAATPGRRFSEALAPHPFGVRLPSPFGSHEGAAYDLLLDPAAAQLGSNSKRTVASSGSRSRILLGEAEIRGESP